MLMKKAASQALGKTPLAKNKNIVVKKSISLSGVVAAWGDEIAEKKGFGSNYSAYIADLIRRDKERDQDLQLGHLSPRRR